MLSLTAGGLTVWKVRFLKNTLRETAIEAVFWVDNSLAKLALGLMSVRSLGEKSTYFLYLSKYKTITTIIEL